MYLPSTFYNFIKLKKFKIFILRQIIDLSSTYSTTIIIILKKKTDVPNLRTEFNIAKQAAKWVSNN